MRVSRVALWVSLSVLVPAMVRAEPARLRIVHTNDLQSRLLGFAPNRDYTPLTVGDDHTIGGLARLATVVRSLVAEAPERTLVLDGGDFMMGTLFHALAETTGSELRLMQTIGYDATVLGNHEFDFRTDGLARTLEAALAAGPIPHVLLANIRFDPDDPGDDELARLFDRGVVAPWRVLERGGLRVGLFGIIGRDAASVAPYARPARFEDPVATAREMVALLRGREAADVVIALSHGAVRRQADGSWGSEDVELARRVPGIDVVISGHSHTALHEPVVVGQTVVVQAGSEGRFVGLLELELDGGRPRLDRYELLPIDDSIAGALDVHQQIEDLRAEIDARVLAPYDLAFDQEIVETAFDLEVDQRSRESLAASNLGPLVADAIRWGIDRGSAPGERTDVALTAAGQVRDDVRRGERGVQQTSDVFRVTGLGIGTVEATPGYPLTRAYLTAGDLENLLEVLTLAYDARGSNHFPYFSGLRFRYNPLRVPLDRVTDIELGDAEGGYRPLDPASAELVSVGMSAYLLGFTHLIEDLSHGLLRVVARDAAGRPLADLDAALVDADPAAPGLQESKEWLALVGYLRHLPDADGDGLPDVPERYRSAEPRMVAEASLDPRKLLRNAGWPMWTASASALVLVVTLAALAWRGLRHAVSRGRRRAPSSP